ncbi:MAG: PAS domain S-box protein [Dehalococcoidia bacterium]
MLELGAHAELLDAVGCGIWVYDGTDVLYVNHALEEISGYSRSELLAPNFFAGLIHPDDIDMIVQRGRARVRGEDVPERYEISILAKSGERRYLSLQARRVDDGSRAVSVVSAVDVTSLRHAKETIREGTTQLAALLNAVPAHIIATDPWGKPTFVNQHWLEFTGQSHEVAMREGTAPLIHPDDRRIATKAWLTALETREPYEISYRVRNRTGQFRWQMFRIRPVKDSVGTFYGWTSVSIDIHDTKALQAELERTVEQLAEAINAKDEVFGLISHELRTPLTTILGNAMYLSRHLDRVDAESLRSIAEDLESHAVRLNDLIENMLVLSRTRTGETEIETEPLLIPRLAEEVVREFEERHPSRCVAFSSTPAVALVEANASYYRQTLSNLLSNANKYSPEDSPIIVEVVEDVRQVRTSVIDAGPGIAEEYVKNIFDPFVRLNTKPGISGLGLGLTLCKRLVELQGGQISVANREGGGCEFSFTLPVMSLPAEA